MRSYQVNIHGSSIAARRNVTVNLSLLNDVVNIDPIPINMANGSITYATKRGSVVLNSKLSLQDVI